MKISAVAVSSSNMKKTIEFYSIIGFKFPSDIENEQHVEPETPYGSARLMIDSEKLMTDMLGEKPKPGNHSSFAVEFENSEEIDKIAKKLEENSFKIIKHPWKAFWGQYYCIVQDPDGYRVDLYCDV